MARGKPRDAECPVADISGRFTNERLYFDEVKRHSASLVGASPQEMLDKWNSTRSGSYARAGILLHPDCPQELIDEALAPCSSPSESYHKGRVYNLIVIAHRDSNTREAWKTVISSRAPRAVSEAVLNPHLPVEFVASLARRRSVSISARILLREDTDYETAKRILLRLTGEDNWWSSTYRRVIMQGAAKAMSSDRYTPAQQAELLRITCRLIPFDRGLPSPRSIPDARNGLGRFLEYVFWAGSGIDLLPQAIADELFTMLVRDQLVWIYSPWHRDTISQLCRHTSMSQPNADYIVERILALSSRLHAGREPLNDCPCKSCCDGSAGFTTLYSARFILGLLREGSVSPNVLAGACEYGEPAYAVNASMNPNCPEEWRVYTALKYKLEAS